MVGSLDMGTVVVQEWTDDKGLSEVEQQFATADELFAICLKVSDPQIIERVIMQGTDDQGRPRTLTFTFQSVSLG